ncbi:Arm DNA-binding domain-containing protein [Enterovirga sp. CN4-39]|uniref:Arm DNA-binding domain-containing protein n=1 Tax=Enterovirga sp. CN4-39 TaxID=3400910 RepID=UPI003BFF552C
MFVTPAGSKLWRFCYSWAGKEKLLSLGAYPEVTLAEARAARDDAKASLRTPEPASRMSRRRLPSPAPSLISKRHEPCSRGSRQLQRTR